MALTQEELAAKFGLGLEDNDLNVNVTATHEGEEEEGGDEDTLEGEIDTSDQPEAAELDLDEAADDVDDAADKVEDLEQAEQALEAFYLTGLSIGAENFTPSVGKMLNCGVNQALTTFGLTTDDIDMPSVEEFDYSPTAAYTGSMEKIGESLANARKNAGKWLEELWKQFVKFLTEMFNSAKRARTKTENILKAGEKTKVQENAKIKIAAVIGNDFTSSRIKNFNNLLSSLVTAKYADIQAALSKEGIQTQSVKTIFDKSMAGVKNFDGKTFIGGVTVKAKDGVVSLDNSNRSEKTAEVKVPTLAEGKLIGKELLETSKLIIDYNDKKDARERFNKFMAKANAEQNGSTDKDNKNFFERRAVVREAGKIWRETIAFERGLIRHAIAVVNAGNNALFQTFKAKKEGKDDKAKDKK